MEKIREHENYFGLVARTFTALSNFDLTPARCGFGFDTWATIDCFETGKPPIERMRADYNLNAATFSEFKTANADLFARIEAAGLAIAEAAPERWEFEFLSISTTDKVLVVTVKTADGDDRQMITKTRDGFDRTVQSNIELIGDVMTLTTGYARERDAFFGAQIQ